MKEFDILGIIDAWWGTNREDVKKALDSADMQPVVFNIASEGGSVFEGLSIAAMIADYKGKTTAKGYGIVASIATVIMLACDEKKMSKSGFFMIHNAWTFTAGNKEQLEKDKELLSKIDTQLVNVYVSCIEKAGKLIDGDKGKTEKEVRRMMEAETWLTAQEALDLGFIDSIIEEEQQFAQFEAKAFARLRAQAGSFKNIPKTLQQMSNDKKTFLAQLAEFFGFKATIEEQEEQQTDAQPALEEPKAEEAPKEEPADNKEAERIAQLEQTIEELKVELNAKTKQLEEIEAKAAARITGKTEQPTQAKQDDKYPADLIKQADDFVKQLFKK